LRLPQAESYFQKAIRGDSYYGSNSDIVSSTLVCRSKSRWLSRGNVAQWVVAAIT